MEKFTIYCECGGKMIQLRPGFRECDKCKTHLLSWDDEKRGKK